MSWSTTTWSGPSVLELIGADAERIYVGKERSNHSMAQPDINALLVRLARAGRQVVRLKGGDPFVFGRGGEELQALAAAGVPFEVVPGITAACGVASYAGIPLTHRDHAQSLPVRHRPPEGRQLRPRLAGAGARAPDGGDLHGPGRAGRDLRAARSRTACRPHWPAAVVEQGTIASTARRLRDAGRPGRARSTRAGLRSPCLTIVGEVVRLRDELAWFGERSRDGSAARAHRRRRSAPSAA